MASESATKPLWSKRNTEFCNFFVRKLATPHGTASSTKFALSTLACLQLSYMPQQWKSAIVIMIFKPCKDPILVISYRPISLLNTFSKLLERVVLIRLSDWLDEKHILSEPQAGIRKNKQTKDHKFRIIQDVQAAFNRGFKVGAIFIDIKKAFEKVCHEGLFKLDQLKVLNYFGKWIANYLESRTFSV